MSKWPKNIKEQMRANNFKYAFIEVNTFKYLPLGMNPVSIFESIPIGIEPEAMIEIANSYKDALLRLHPEWKENFMIFTLNYGDPCNGKCILI